MGYFKCRGEHHWSRGGRDRSHFKDRSDGESGSDLGGSFSKPITTESVAVALNYWDKTRDGGGQ